MASKSLKNLERGFQFPSTTYNVKEVFIKPTYVKPGTVSRILEKYGNSRSKLIAA